MKRWFREEAQALATGLPATRVRDVGPLPPSQVEDWQGRPEDANSPQFWGALWCVEMPEMATVGRIFDSQGLGVSGAAAARAGEAPEVATSKPGPKKRVRRKRG